MALLDAAYILAAVRRLLAEYSSVKFTDDHLNKWIQEAAMDISLKTLGYEVKDSITTAANTLEQNEPSGCIKLHSCVKGGGGGWIEHLDDDDWEEYPAVGASATWDGTKWVFTLGTGGTPGITQAITPKSGATWHVGYRPTHIRITWDHGSKTQMYTYAWPSWYSDSSYESGDEISLDTSGGDITRFWITDTDAMGSQQVYNVTNIEFYETPDTDYKGLSRVHPRLIQHVAHNETGAPIHYYHHHNKIGIWPLPDDTYTVGTYCSNVTDDITDLPSELRLLAIPYCLAMARLTEGWKDDFEMFITMYLNSLMPHRADRGQYKLNDVDARDKFWIPQGKIVNG